MSDKKLRELERIWKRTGTSRDEAAYLQERVRAGELPTEKLALAAHLGHLPACTVLETLPPQSTVAENLALKGTFSPEDLSLINWVLALRSWDPAAPVRAAVVAARLVLKPDSDPACVEAVEAAEAWFGCPCPAHAEEVLRGTLGARAARSQEETDWLANTVCEAGMAVQLLSVDSGAAGSQVANAVATGALRSAGRAGDPAAIRDAIREAFVPELLGYLDDQRREP